MCCGKGTWGGGRGPSSMLLHQQATPSYIAPCESAYSLFTYRLFVGNDMVVVADRRAGNTEATSGGSQRGEGGRGGGGGGGGGSVLQGHLVPSEEALDSLNSKLVPRNSSLSLTSRGVATATKAFSVNSTVHARVTEILIELDCCIICGAASLPWTCSSICWPAALGIASICTAGRKGSVEFAISFVLLSKIPNVSGRESSGIHVFCLHAI